MTIAKNKFLQNLLIFLAISSIVSLALYHQNISGQDEDPRSTSRSKITGKDFYSVWKTLYNITGKEKQQLYPVQPVIEGINENPVILIWTTYFGYDPMNMISYEGIRSSKCKNVCNYTKDRKRFQEVDAVIFHYSSIDGKDNPIALKQLRPPGQIWIYNNLECPLYMNPKPAEILSASPTFYSSFNWTMTYRRDSDIYHPYGTVIKRDKSLPNWDKSQINEINLKIKNKTKLVIWPVSHCHTSSRREELVAELQSYIPIDIVGHCGVTSKNRKACVKNGSAFDPCFREFEAEYKFILAFENSICQDYITEKFFNALRFYIVPIVYSGGDFTGVGAIPGSYIDVRDFNSSEQLAKYLSHLDKNDEEYAKYFEYKLSHEVEGWGKRSWCDLCDKLHMRSPGRKWYPNIVEWYENMYENRTRKEGTRACVDKDKINFRKQWTLLQNVL